jgi:PH domain
MRQSISKRQSFSAPSTSTWQGTLEKKARGRNNIFSLFYWNKRTFTLVGQELSYFDGAKKKGSININAATMKILTPTEADGRPFAFEVTVTGER